MSKRTDRDVAQESESHSAGAWTVSKRVKCDGDGKDNGELFRCILQNGQFTPFVRMCMMLANVLDEVTFSVDAKGFSIECLTVHTTILVKGRFQCTVQHHDSKNSAFRISLPMLNKFLKLVDGSYDVSICLMDTVLKVCEASLVNPVGGGIEMHTIYDEHPEESLSDMLPDGMYSHQIIIPRTPLDQRIRGAVALDIEEINMHLCMDAEAEGGTPAEEMFGYFTIYGKNNVGSICKPYLLQVVENVSEESNRDLVCMEIVHAVTPANIREGKTMFDLPFKTAMLAKVIKGMESSHLVLRFSSNPDAMLIKDCLCMINGSYVSMLISALVHE